MTLAARLGRPRGERRARDHPARHDAAPGGDVADAAVAMLVVVPLDEPHRPLPGSVQIGEPLSGNSGRYFAVRNSASANSNDSP